MTTSPTDHRPWGQLLRTYRKQADLTQGQFIEQLSFLVAQVGAEERHALEAIGVFDDAVVYFSGVLDSPTLSRLEKGSRSLNSRRRCVALVWGLNRLGVLTQHDEANTFLDLAGHGNLTDAERDVLLGPDDTAIPGPAATESSQTARKAKTPRRALLAGAGLVAGALIAFALIASTLFPSFARSTPDGSEPAGPGASSHVLLADELHSVTGDTGRDQTLVGLHELDNRGSSDNWLEFVKFIAADTGDYSGYRAYYLPEHIPVEAITGIRLEVNYRGPDYEAAPWVWQVERRDISERVRLGDNRDSLWWQDWTNTSFTFPGDDAGFDASLYIQDRQIWISLDGSRADDSIDLDYEVLVVEWSDSDL